MVDTTIASTDVTVFGGPTEVVVDVNYGPQGKRGTYIYSSLGFPVVGQNVPSDSQTYDIAIDIKTFNSSGDYNSDYLKMYQYIIGPTGVPEWKTIASLADLVKGTPITFNYVSTFVSGSKTINFPFFGLENFDGLALNIQVTFQSEYPIASSVEYSIGSAGNDNNLYLPITIHAIKYATGEWSVLTGSQEFSISVTLMPDSSVITI